MQADARPAGSCEPLVRDMQAQCQSVFGLSEWQAAAQVAATMTIAVSEPPNLLVEDQTLGDVPPDS